MSDALDRAGCTEACWTLVPCPGCGKPLPPRGRSAPIEWSIGACCAEAQYDRANTAHAWSRADALEIAEWLERDQ